MITYVDSNVILEAILGQPQSESALALLSLAETGRCELRLPVFVLYEIEQRLERLSAVRQALATVFGKHAEAMGLANPEVAAEGKLAADAMRDRFLTEDRDLQVAKSGLLHRVLAVADVLPMTSAVLARATRLAGEEANLHFADAIVAATVLEDAAVAQTECLLVTRDGGISKDADVAPLLEGNRCRVIGSIAGAVNYIRSKG